MTLRRSKFKVGVLAVIMPHDALEMGCRPSLVAGQQCTLHTMGNLQLWQQLVHLAEQLVLGAALSQGVHGVRAEPLHPPRHPLLQPGQYQPKAWCSLRSVYYLTFCLQSCWKELGKQGEHVTLSTVQT